jgi:hypothetical protein
MSTDVQPTNIHRVPPTPMLDGRASFAYLNGIAIVLSDIPKWTDKLVLEFIEHQATLAGCESGTSNITHFFGDIFGASHRKLIVDWIAQKGLQASPRTAMITESTLMRAALTAYSWLTKTEVKAFESKDVDALCKWSAHGSGVNPEEVKSALLACYKILGKTP